MALITCKDCEKEFSSDAKRCPHCNAKKPVIPRKKWPWKKIILVVFLFSMASHVINFAIQDAKPHKTEAQLKQADERNTEIGAGILCQDLVRKSLHDPDSAEFDDPASYYVTNKKGIYTVSVTLRAKNGFNAMRKMTAECSLLIGKDKTIPLGVKEIH